MSESDAIAAGRPGHGAGSAAAELIGVAAALAERVARASHDRWIDAEATATSASAARTQARELAAENRDAYAAARDVLEDPEDNLDIGLALGRTLLILRHIGTLAADVAELCRAAAEHGDPDLVADAVGGACYAAAAARAASHLIAINLTTRADDETIAAARADAQRAESAALAAESLGG